MYCLLDCSGKWAGCPSLLLICPLEKGDSMPHTPVACRLASKVQPSKKTRCYTCDPFTFDEKNKHVE